MRILIVGHGRSPTGLGRVTDFIGNSLVGIADIHHLALDLRLPSLGVGAQTFHGVTDPDDVNGRYRLAELLERLKPAVLIVIADLWHLALLAETFSARPPAVRIAYVPVDGLLGTSLPKQFQAFTHLVVAHAFGRDQLVQALPNQPLPLIIPHANAGDLFQPLGWDALQRAEARRQFHRRADLDHAFIVFNGSKNQQRNRLDLTIAGFAQFVRNTGADAYLHLHTRLGTIGYDVQSLAHQAGIGGRLLLSPEAQEVHPTLGNMALNALYQQADVGVNTSEGENWGHMAFEQALVGVPQIVPDHSAYAALWAANPWRTRVAHRYQHPGLRMERAIIDPEDLAEQLILLHADSALRAAAGVLCRRIAADPAYHPAQIAPSWRQLVSTAVAG